MSADLLLSRLEKVKRTGAGSWIACCPAHQDRTPSLAITEKEDGRILIYCHAMCGAVAVLDAVGLEYDALFPEKLPERSRPLRRPFPAADVLECLAEETRIVAQAAIELSNGWEPSADAKERVMLAAERIEAGRRMANG